MDHGYWPPATVSLTPGRCCFGQRQTRAVNAPEKYGENPARPVLLASKRIPRPHGDHERKPARHSTDAPVPIFSSHQRAGAVPAAQAAPVCRLRFERTVAAWRSP